MDNKILLYTTGNYVQYPVTNHHGKEYEKDYIYIYISTYTDTHVYVCVCSVMSNFLGPHGQPAPLSKKIFEARILQWVAIFYSRVSSRSRVRAQFSCISCIGNRRTLYHRAPWEAHTWNNLKQYRFCNT